MSDEMNHLPKKVNVVIGKRLFALKPYTLRMKKEISTKWGSEKEWFEKLSSQDPDTVLDTLLLMFVEHDWFTDRDTLAESLPGSAIALDQVTTAIWENYLASCPEMAEAVQGAAKKKRDRIIAEMQAKLTE